MSSPASELRRGSGQRCEAPPSPTALSGKSLRSSPVRLGEPVLEGVDQVEVPHDERTDEKKAHLDASHHPAPATCDVDRRPVLDPRVRALDGASSRVGATPGDRGVVVYLAGLHVDPPRAISGLDRQRSQAASPHRGAAGGGGSGDRPHPRGRGEGSVTSQARRPTLLVRSASRRQR